MRSGDPSNSVPLAVWQVAQLYNFPDIAGAPDQTIGIIAASNPPGVTSIEQCGYIDDDITKYFKSVGNSSYQQPPNINPVGLTVGANSYTNNTSAVSGSNQAAKEVTMDIDVCATVAQGAAINVYFTDSSELGYTVCLQEITIPTKGEPQATVVSCSFASTTEIGAGSLSDGASMASVMIFRYTRGSIRYRDFHDFTRLWKQRSCSRHPPSGQFGPRRVSVKLPVGHLCWRDGHRKCD